jgi:RHS repeat-associated protein
MVVKRDGACAPSAGSCWQRFAYAWDEAGRLMTARRWDLTTTERTSNATVASAAPTRAADALLSYRYAGDDTRVLKSLVQGGATLHTAYVFPSYTLRRAAVAGTGTAADYVQSASTEEVRLEAGGEAVGRVLVSTADLGASAVTGQRVLLTLGDSLGSTATVIDRETGELVEAVAYTSYGQSESDVRPDRYKGLREDVRFTGNEDDVEVGLTAFAKRYYAPALGRWASPDPLAVHAPGEADLNLYAYVHGRVYAATDPLGLELAWAALGTCPAPSVPSAATVKSFVTTGAKVGLAIAICTQYAGICVGAAAFRLVTEGVDHDAAGKVLLEEAPTLAGARFIRRGKPGAPAQAIVEKELAATAPAAPIAPLGEAAGGGLGRLRSIGRITWESSGGLVYGPDKVFGNRVQHMLAHTVPDATKPMHSVFNVGRNQVLGLVDEAWSMRGAAVAGDPGAFVVPMGRAVGTAGETAVRIVVRPGTSQIITAYPVMP